jgi:hypothetical protein
VRHPQSHGIDIVAHSTDDLVHSVAHWLGITAPYAPVSRDGHEADYAVRAALHFSAAAAPAEEAVTTVAALSSRNKELLHFARACEAALEGAPKPSPLLQQPDQQQQEQERHMLAQQPAQPAAMPAGSGGDAYA